MSIRFPRDQQYQRYDPRFAQAGSMLGDEPVPARVNAWLRLTSVGWDRPLRSPEEREVVRRSRLTSWIILGLLIVLLVLIPGALSAPATLSALGGVLIGLLIIASLNRAGWVTAAGAILVGILDIAILGAVAGVDSGLSLIYLPAFDLFVISIVVAASVLPRMATFIVAALNIVLIIGDYLLQPHAPDLDQAVHTFGAVGVLDRPIALQIIVAVVAFLWACGTDSAIRRADRAEEIANLEHALADQKRQLDIGIQQILQTHVRAANGDYSARAPLGQDNILWNIAQSLNNLLQRLQRTGQAEFQLRRTQEELQRLATAIDDAQAGRAPMWPAPAGTPADMIVDRITRSMRRPLPGGFAEQPVAPSLSQGYSAPQSNQFGQPFPSAPSQQASAWAPPAENPWGQSAADHESPWAFPQDGRE